MERTEKVPYAGESDHGIALDDEQLRTLVQGFKGPSLFPIISVAAFTGARRNEVLALRWTDLDPANKTLRIERATKARLLVSSAQLDRIAEHQLAPHNSSRLNRPILLPNAVRSCCGAQAFLFEIGKLSHGLSGLMGTYS